MNKRQRKKAAKKEVRRCRSDLAHFCAVVHKEHEKRLRSQFESIAETARLFRAAMPSVEDAARAAEQFRDAMAKINLEKRPTS